MRGALLAASSGAALLAAAPPLDLTPLVLLALAPLLLAVRRASGAATVATLGWLTGAVFYAGLLVWLPSTIARMEGVGWMAAVTLSSLFVAAHALQVALAALGARLGCSPATRIVATTAAWVLLEYGFPKVFPWSLGAALGPHPLLRQAADLAGAHGLAALVVAINAAIAEAIASWSDSRIRAGAELALAAVLIIGAAVYGCLEDAAFAVPGRAEARPSRAARIAVVQAGPSADGGSDPHAVAAAVWARYADLSESLAGHADVILWPEDVLRLYLRDAGQWRQRAETLAQRLRAALVIGALDRTADGSELNAAFFFTPALSAVAHKATLVPFGEYLPGAAGWLPLREWRPAAAPRAGAPPPIVDAAGIRIAPSICFEAILPGHFSDSVRGGAEVLVNLSDDSWFAGPWAAAQHLEMTRLRAVETRRWLVRASHSGISAVVDPRGAIVAALPYGMGGTLVHAVEGGRALTPYARWGDAPLVTVAALLLLVASSGSRVGRATSPAPLSQL